MSTEIMSVEEEARIVEQIREGRDKINAELSKTVEASEAFRLNRLFHAALHDAAKNRFLRQSMVSLQKALMILGPTTLGESDRFEGALAEHEALLAALKNRDGARAEALMRAHIEASQRARIRSVW